MAVRRGMPMPSKPKRGQRTVPVPPLVAAKLAVFQAMLEEGVNQVELAAWLYQDDRQVGSCWTSSIVPASICWSRPCMLWEGRWFWR
jgi:hypothetical protein